MNLTSHEHVRRMWLVLAGLLLGFSSSAVAATIPPARELTAAELQRLAKIKAWRITYHQDFAQNGLAAGVGGFIPTDLQAIVELRTSTLQYTRSVDAHFLVSGTPGCSSCNADYSEPVQIHFASSLGENEVLDLSSCGPRQPDGSPTPGHQASSYTRVVGPADFTLTGSGGQMPGAMPGEPPSFPYGHFFLDYGSNPPRANAFFGTPDFTGTGTLTFAGCLQNFGPTPSLASDSVEMRFAFNGDPTVVESYGDTQVRIEPDGQFVIKGYADTAWSTERCITSFLIPCTGSNPELFGTRRETSHTTWEARPVTPGGGDLEVVSVEPVQSVFGAPMIAGKDTVIAVDIANTFTHPVSARVSLAIDEPPFAERILSETITVPAGCPGSKRFYFPSPDPASRDCAPAVALGSLRSQGLAPIAGGNSYVVVANIAATQDTESDLSNNKASSVPVPVKETQLSIAYTQVACLTGPCTTDPLSYGDITGNDFAVGVEFGNLHVLGMFPLSPEGFSGTICTDAQGLPCVVPGDSRKCTGAIDDFSLCRGIRSDFARARRQARQADPTAQRIVLMVPTNYLRYHQFEDPSGFFIGGSGADDIVLVKAESPSGDNRFHKNLNTVPHELVHSFGGGHIEVDPSPGYWVGCTPNFPDCAAGSTNLMNPRGEQPPAAWIDQPTYAGLLLPLLKVGPDPVVLDITGAWTRDGAVEIDSMDELPNGVASLVVGSGGEGSIDLLDDGGALISHRSVDLDFHWFKEDAADTIVHSKMGLLAFSIEYPPQAALLRFKQGDRIVLQIDPAAQTLRTTLKSIPDRGFRDRDDAAEIREKLLREVDKFESALAKCGRHPAEHRLAEIRKSVEKRVTDYPAGDPLELSKPKVLSAIDRIAARLTLRHGRNGSGCDEDEHGGDDEQHEGAGKSAHPEHHHE